ncbi:PspC domain-containing protein [Candidatus Latescibacterota bacterium]
MEKMENNEMKKCPYCAEMIQSDAIKCRFCGTNLSKKKEKKNGRSPSSDDWHRVSEGKRIAGVVTGIANQFDAPQIILPLRLFFIISTLFWGFGLILYIALWILMPSETGGTEQINDGSVPPVSADTLENTEVTPRKKTNPVDYIIALFLIIAGLMFVFGFFFNTHIFPLSIFGHHISFPYIVHPHFIGDLSWIPFSFLTVLTIFGLFILFIGGLKIIRFFVGCGLVLLGTIFLLIFVPFLPLMFPGLLILGLILIIIGGLKLLF